MTCLSQESADPDSDEDQIPVQTFEHVSLSVDFSGINFVEQSHHDKRIEDDCEMLVRSDAECDVTTVVDVKQSLTWSYLHVITVYYYF